MHITFANTPDARELDRVLLPADEPEFISYAPNFELIDFICSQYEGYKNVVVIGNGGSINSFYALYQSFKDICKKKVYLVSTVDPDYLSELKQSLDFAHTLVVTISKSGENIAQIEATLEFKDYKLLSITDKTSPLGNIVQALGGEIVEHPHDIGGRFAGLTEEALIPAALCGINVRQVAEGARPLLQSYGQTNIAFTAADIFYQLEKKGVVDVFMPTYSHYVSGFGVIAVQLCHETFGKNEAGQTYFAHEAPESQHHTNQRFFGGRRNIAGFFTVLDRFRKDSLLEVSENLKSVTIKNQPISRLDNWTLAKSMRAEFEGTWEDAQNNGIPMCVLTLEQRSESEIGGLLAFWQLFALYGAFLRGVNAFDQPQVESSKLISFHKRFPIN